MRIEYHRTLLADRVRNEAFQRALARVIVPGETVVADIGAGTGIMGFLAARLGAKKVYAYEGDEVMAVAWQLAKRNKLKAWEPIPALSTEFLEPPRVDVVVSETLGNYAFEESIITTMNDVRERHLVPGGIVIPGVVEQYVCPVIDPRLHRELATWDDVGFGLDLAPAKLMSYNNMYVRWLLPTDLLDGGSAAQRWDRVDLSARNRTTRSGEAAWAIGRPLTVYGVAVWWRAELVPGVVLATGPLDPRTHWEQLYLPVVEPIVLAAGERLRTTIRSTTTPERGTDVAWTLHRLDRTGRPLTRQSMSLEKGFLP